MIIATVSVRRLSLGLWFRVTLAQSELLRGKVMTKENGLCLQRSTVRRIGVNNPAGFL